MATIQERGKFWPYNTKAKSPCYSNDLYRPSEKSSRPCTAFIPVNVVKARSAESAEAITYRTPEAEHECKGLYGEGACSGECCAR